VAVEMKNKVLLMCKQRLLVALIASVIAIACISYGHGVRAEIVEDISKYLPFHPPEGDPQYVLEQNPYLPFCQKVVEHLRANPQMNRINACEFPITPKANGFTKPKWEVLDPAAHMDIVREIFMHRVFWRYYRAPHTNPLPSQEEKDKAWNHDPQDPAFHLFREKAPGGLVVRYTLREYLNMGAARLERARFDLDFDGKPDTVYRFLRGSCDTNHPQTLGGVSWTYHVLERDGPKLHEEITSASMRTGFDIIRYDGRTYVVELGGGTMAINETKYDKGRRQPTSYLVCSLSVPVEQITYPNWKRN